MDEKTRQQMQKLVEEKKPEPSKTAPSKGVGDTVAKFTKAIGIKPCGPCERRRQWLNQRFSYRPK